MRVVWGDLQCGGSALEFSRFRLVISCVAGKNGLRFLLEDGCWDESRGLAGRAVAIAAGVVNETSHYAVVLIFRLDCNLNRVLRQWGANRPIWFELGGRLVGIGLLLFHVLLCEGWIAYRTATACSERLHAGAATCLLLVYIYRETGPQF